MKNLLFLLLSGILLISCKKEEKKSIDNTITYTHWYKTRSSSADTLFSVYIPNAFSPNGDGINDTFFPKGEFTGNYFSLKVFDRNGTVLFNTNEPYFYPGWTGNKTNTYGAVEGAYTYQLKLNDAVGDNHEFEGSVILFR